MRCRPEGAALAAFLGALVGAVVVFIATYAAVAAGADTSGLSSLVAAVFAGLTGGGFGAAIGAALACLVALSRGGCRRARPTAALVVAVLLPLPTAGWIVLRSDVGPPGGEGVAVILFLGTVVVAPVVAATARTVITRR